VQPLEKLLLAAGVVLLSPYLPLLFMGEEYGEKTPFHYFVGYTDPELIAAVRKGKNEEHASGVCEGPIPDPEAESVFWESKIDLTLPKEGEQALILEFYRQLLALRKKLPALQVFRREKMEVTGLAQQKTLVYRRDAEASSLLSIFCFSNTQEHVTLTIPVGHWDKILDSSAQHWRGPGEVAPASIAVAAAGTESTITMNPFSLLVYSSSS
jgi:maltooligosyltrehalose trehalohydrolase